MWGGIVVCMDGFYHSLEHFNTMAEVIVPPAQPRLENADRVEGDVHDEVFLFTGP